MKNIFIKAGLKLLMTVIIAAGITVPVVNARADALKKYAAQPLNSLAGAASPYLLQHSRDLVQWRAWNDATLKEIRQSGKPVFLSIGYSACHWCHVMQEQSFNNEAVAKLLNDNFIPVLVDRERRPDLDEVYMIATQAMTGIGGWPNNLLLTPDLKPFYAGVYFPPANLIKLLTIISDDWKNQELSIRAEGERISAIISQYFKRKISARELDVDLVKKASAKLAASFDVFNGGIGSAPKHFNAPVLSFLARMAEKYDDRTALGALEVTLKAIMSGGVRDQLAGGFHRYAVDNNWRTPHFEKMLYDQAMLTEIYSRAYSITGNEQYADVVRSTLDYVRNDLTAPDGGFYSTRDADSEGEEGSFYVWTSDQLEQALGGEDAAFIISTLSVANSGEFAGKVIIHRNIELEGSELARFDALLAKLEKHRRGRIVPFRDEKIIAGWNGLMISAFAVASIRLDAPQYTEIAKNAADFVWSNMRRNDGRLYRVFYDGKASVTGTLKDYAYVARSFIDVYDASGKTVWLERAVKIADKMNELFLDKENGDYFLSETRQGYARAKLLVDGSLPSGNAVALDVYGKLSRRSLKPEYGRMAEALIAALSGVAAEDAHGGASILAAAGRYLRGEAGPLQYAVHGRVRVAAKLAENGERLDVSLVVAKGWHINSHKPLDDDYIATSVDVKNASGEGVYPQSVTKKFGFSDKPLAVYEGTVAISTKLESAAKSRIRAEVTVQACNDQVCLLPETLKVDVSPKR